MKREYIDKNFVFVGKREHNSLLLRLLRNMPRFVSDKTEFFVMYIPEYKPGTNDFHAAFASRDECIAVYP